MNYRLLKRSASWGPRHLKNILFYGYSGKPIRIMVEISGKCNLQCPLCYWRKRKDHKELTDEQWVARIKSIIKRNPNILGAAWLGGEPMLRFNLIKKLSKYFLHNVIISNGTLPLKKLKKTSYWISVDGTKEYFEKQRGPVYEAIKRNIERAETRVTIKCVISGINKSCLEDFVKEWSVVKNVGKIMFSFYTPEQGNLDDKNWVNQKEREIIIKKLAKLSLRYPALLKKSVEMLKIFSAPTVGSIPKACKRNPQLYIDSRGKEISNFIKDKHVCGYPSADCDRCGNYSAMKATYNYHNRYKAIKNFFRN